MPVFVSARRDFLLATLGAGAALLAGCGQGEYDQRMAGIQNVLATRRTAAGNTPSAKNIPPGMVADEYYSVTDPAGAKTGIKLRLPVQYSGATTLREGDPGAKAWLLNIPGFCCTMQTQVADETGKQFPASVHFYSVKKLEVPADQLRQTILQAAQGVEASANWRASPENGKPGFIDFHAIVPTRDFEFQVNGAGEKRREEMMITTNETPENTVVICWQYETKSGTASKLSANQGAAMDSMMLDGPPGAPPAGNPAGS